MALKQTRRTISFHRELFELVHEAAQAENKSASQWATEQIREGLAKLGKTLPAQHFAGPAPHGRKNHRGGVVRGGLKPKSKSSNERGA